MSQLSEQVREWLSQEERNQAYLARKAGIDDSYLSMILNGQRKPGARVLGRLEAVMQLKEGTLVSLRDAESQAGSEPVEVPNGDSV